MSTKYLVDGGECEECGAYGPRFDVGHSILCDECAQENDSIVELNDREDFCRGT